MAFLRFVKKERFLKKMLIQSLSQILQEFLYIASLCPSLDIR